MALYPLVGTIHYEDDILKMKIPLRAKLIVFNSYVCPKCDLRGSMKQWEREYERITSKTEKDFMGIKITVRANEEHVVIDGQYIPKEMVIDNKPICSQCKNKLERKDVSKIKIYVANKKRYLDMSMIIDQVTGVRRPRKSYNRFNGNEDAVAYYDYTKAGLKQMKEDVSWLKKYQKGLPRCHPFINSKYVAPKPAVTLKALKKGWETYNKKKVIRSI